MRREEAGKNDPGIEEERLWEEESELLMNKLRFRGSISLHENIQHTLETCLEVGQRESWNHRFSYGNHSS